MIFKLANKMFSTMADVYLPLLLFAFSTIFYCDKAINYTTEADIYHVLFYVFISLLSLFLFFTKKTRESILILLIFVSYVTINRLKYEYTGTIEKMSYFQILNFLIPINWFFYLMLDYLKLPKKYDFYMLGVCLFEGALFENFQFDFEDGFGIIINCLWFISIISYIIYVSLSPNMKKYGAFFAFLCVGLGILNCESALALSVYFSFAILIILITLIYTDVYCYFKDALTGVYSVNSYIKHSKNFPLKYSLGVICVDDYTKLLRVFGYRHLNKLIKMLVMKIKEISTTSDIYRYNEDEFILIFKNEDKKQCFECLENIRRAIAGAEFVINSKRIVKITISAGVSEKKRSDADAEVVLTRTREAVQRTYRFTQNMTSKA